MGSVVKIVFSILKNSLYSFAYLLIAQNFHILLLALWRCQAVSFKKAITGFMCLRPDVSVASV